MMMIVIVMMIATLLSSSCGGRGGIQPNDLRSMGWIQETLLEIQTLQHGIPVPDETAPAGG